MQTKKRWSDLSSTQRTLIVLGGVVQFGLLIAALWDLSRRPAAEIRGNKWLWSAVSFVNYIGPIAYFAFGRKPAEETPVTDILR